MNLPHLDRSDRRTIELITLKDEVHDLLNA